MRLKVLTSVAIVVLFASSANADERTLAERHAAISKTVRKGSIAKYAKQKVDVGGRGKVSIDQLARVALAEHRKMDGQLAKAKDSLFGQPVVEEEVLETEHVTVISSTTRFVVAEPGKLRAAGGRFGSYGNRLKAVGLNELTKDARKGFDDLKARATKFPKGHPLRKAADQGDQALLDAVSMGLGDVSITTSVSVAKKPLTVSATGSLLVPQEKEGVYDYSDLRESATSKLVASGGMAPTSTGRDMEWATGQDQKTWQLLAGDTKGDSFHWDEKWKFPSGYFRVSAHASYAIGLRIPIEITTTVSPLSLIRNASPDVVTQYSVSMAAKTLDAPASFYTNVGLDKDLVQDGKEFVFNLSAWARVEFHAGFGLIKIDEKFPKNSSIDKGRDFVPPFGDCGTKCGFDVWVPADVTKTSINLGVVKASAQVGFLVGGIGTVGIQYTSLFRGETDSNLNGVTKRHHTLRFTGGHAQGVSTVMAPFSVPKSEPFGFRLDQLDYDWKVELTPGLKATVEVDGGKWFSIKETLGPWWLSFVEIPVGSFDLDAHPGTTSVIEVTPGTRAYTGPTKTKNPVKL